jgi:hypothetical protein
MDIALSSKVLAQDHHSNPYPFFVMILNIVKARTIGTLVRVDSNQPHDKISAMHRETKGYILLAARV